MAMGTDLLRKRCRKSISMTALQWLEFALATPAVLVGRLADLSARLGFAGQPQLTCSALNCARRRRGVDIQRGGDAAAWNLPARDRSMMAQCGYFEAAA